MNIQSLTGAPFTFINKVGALKIPVNAHHRNIEWMHDYCNTVFTSNVSKIANTKEHNVLFYYLWHITPTITCKSYHLDPFKKIVNYYF